MIYLLCFALTQTSYLENMTQEKPCSTCSSGPEIPEREPGNLMVFMSSSAPLETWIDLSAQLEKTAGRFLLKGFPDNSFEGFRQMVAKLKLAKVGAPIDIDPASFEQYKIGEIPAFVLEDGKKWDKVEGNLRVDAALREMAEKGETSKRAKEILKQL